MKKDSIDIIKEILIRNKEIENLFFLEFGKYDLIQDRIDLNGSLNHVFNDALKVRDSFNLPFWDSFNLSLFEKEIDDYSFLNEIKFHNNSTKRILYNREEFLANQVDFNNYTAICSLVNQDNSNYHIPLFDFHIPVSENNKNLCLSIIKTLHLTGYLLDSGKSYHFIGNKITDTQQMLESLYSALLYSPIIDKSWVAHQLIQKFCCLRVSKKYERLPVLVEEIK